MKDDFNLNDLINKNRHILHLTDDEARLVDWLITVHSWDYDLFSRLNSPDMIDLRKEIAQVILAKKNYIDLGKEDFIWLLTCTPITFRWGYTEDIGKSLKTKLYGLLIDGTDHYDEEVQKKAAEEKKAKEQQQAQNSYDE